MKQDDSLLKTVYANDENLLDQVKSQLQAGADPNECTEYFETPLRVSSRLGRFDVVKLLFESGADPSHLNWTPLFHAVAYGSMQQVQDCVGDGADLSARDTWERTPFLLAIQRGDTDIVSYLIDAGADISDTGRCDKPALEYAIQMDNANMLTFLIQKGLDFERYNPFGYTPLMQAAEDGAINCVKTLLKQGANIYKTDRSQFSQKTAIAHASTIEIAEVLSDAGDDLNQLEGEIRAKLLKIGDQETLSIDKKEYLSQKNRKFGTSNPQKCVIPFWYDMVRCNAGAWKAREQFDDKDSFNDQPVWCYERFGKSITAIGGGEYIEIAGEHEDSYDPDFCIYNEVFHHKGNGELTIYQYPENIFPSTDFHTATLVNGYIYAIGNLGYPEERVYGTTPVYRLDINSFKIETIETSGECPGWIYNHSAILKSQSIIRIQGGEILEKTGDEETHQLNGFDFELELNTLKWTKHDHTPQNGNIPFFPEEYKRFNISDETLVAVEGKNEWRLLKVISVYRIDVFEGEQIQFERETVTASSDDFLFVVAYSTSKPFDSFKLLEKAVADKSWKFENTCQVCRPTTFPEYSRYIGFGNITEEEQEAFRAWKALFEQRQAKIA
jgi:ankyrin repeat protein